MTTNQQQLTSNSSHNLSHIDAKGDVHMVDVSHKSASERQATAQGRVIFPQAVYQQIKDSDGISKKGSIIQTAHIAGVMAAKRTHELIPLCHPLPLDGINLSFNYQDDSSSIEVSATVKVTHKTGVEMEALTAVSVACLTLYDMTKALSHDIIISDIQLLQKTGGKSDYKL